MGDEQRVIVRGGSVVDEPDLLVNGFATQRDGRLTGDLPARVLRSR